MTPRSTLPTSKLTLFNPLYIVFQISNILAKAIHNVKQPGDIDLSGDCNWTFEPVLQKPPLVPVKLLMLNFGFDPVGGIA